MSPDWWRDCRDGIEKCSSPTGDGNEKSDTMEISLLLRNVVPRQGTETEKHLCTTLSLNELRNVVPRQGTETVYTALVVYPIKRLRNVVPRQGTETCVIVFTDF